MEQITVYYCTVWSLSQQQTWQNISIRVGQPVRLFDLGEAARDVAFLLGQVRLELPHLPIRRLRHLGEVA